MNARDFVFWLHGFINRETSSMLMADDLAELKERLSWVGDQTPEGFRYFFRENKKVDPPKTT